jgi:hypothetical protein
MHWDIEKSSCEYEATLTFRGIPMADIGRCNPGGVCLCSRCNLLLGHA